VEAAGGIRDRTSPRKIGIVTTPGLPERSVGMSLKERVARLSARQRAAYLDTLSLATLREMARGEWWYTARPEQIPPIGQWLIYLVLSGRGWGKSRAGSEWIVDRTIKHPVDRSGAPTERLIVAETIADARNICIGGPSGVLRVLRRRRIPYRYVRSPKPVIEFLDTGCLIHVEGADDSDVGRGHNAADAWLDEMAKWPDPRGSWIEGIMPSLRSDIPGDHPRAFVTTTPKPIALLREWVTKTDGSIITVRGSTFDNKMNLSSLVLEALEETYRGTLIGQQELEGALLDASAGKVFSQAHINMARVRSDQVPDLSWVVVGVDPGITGEEDETGIVVVGQDPRHDLYVLGDHSELGVGRDAALRCWRIAAEYGAKRLVVETTQGKKWVVEAFTDAYKELHDEGIFSSSIAPIETVDSKLSKKTRAEPVGIRCEQRRLHFVGFHPKLEAQCVEFDPADKDSPDRLDAMVSACRWLMKREPRRSAVVTPTSVRDESPSNPGGMDILQGLELQLARW
jgi:phage terminase large subunit-like protein